MLDENLFWQISHSNGLIPGKESKNPFKTNGIFHKAKYNYVKMVHCIY